MTTQIRATSPPQLNADVIGTVPTPAYVFSEGRLAQLSEIASEVRQTAGCKVLYSIKAQAFSGVLEALGLGVDGFSVSSLFEARFVRQRFPSAHIHLTTPGLRPSDVGEIGVICNSVSMNSLSQLGRYGRQFLQSSSLGLRVNTGLSYVPDVRYDPCRPHSKLGVPIKELSTLSTRGLAKSVHGLHIHTNSDSTRLSELKANVETLARHLPSEVRIEWVNLGGGYLLDELDSLDPLAEIVASAHRELGGEVFIEPGAALVRSAMWLVSEVVDLFPVEGQKVAVLDTTVNHLPEVLEFDYRPEVSGETESGFYQYILAGSTCLAGDLFGTYGFDRPLKIGARIVLENVGAYSLAKAHRFNGVNLPTICSVTDTGELKVLKHFTFDDFAHGWLPND